MRFDEINFQKVCRYGKKSYGVNLLSKDLPAGARNLDTYQKIFMEDMYRYWIFHNELEKRITKFEKKTGFKFVVKETHETVEELIPADILIIKFEVKPLSQKISLKRLLRSLFELFK